jgi:hypothetical protein
MSKLKATGNSLGTGVVTLETPNTNDTYSVTLPDATGTLLNSDGDGSSLTGVGGNVNRTISYCIVAGGGGTTTSIDASGGGGGGGVLEGTITSVESTTTVIVGAGGGSTDGHAPNSSFGSLIAIGGGTGAAYSHWGYNGGSGGGGGGGNYGPSSTLGSNTSQYLNSTTPITPGGLGIAGQGDIGGEGNFASGRTAGGGGGATPVRKNAYGRFSGINVAGGGGAGRVVTLEGGGTVYYGGGGGGSTSAGASSSPVGVAGVGGSGGGGDGDTVNPCYGSNGSANTGGGAGGGGGATGGSGKVIISYPNTEAAATSTTGSPTYTNTGGNHIYVWTTSGTITF